MSHLREHKEATVEAISDRHEKSRVRSGIDALIRGSSKRLVSSQRLEWQGIRLELHHASPAERAESISADHLIAVITNHVARGESLISAGRFRPYSYFPGTINLFPVGPIPACRPSTDTKMIICALDPNFLTHIGAELDLSLSKEFCGRTNIRDHSLEGIIMLLAAEARSGAMSGTLYTEHLTHALALRFIQLTADAQHALPLLPKLMPNRPLRRVLERMEEEAADKLDLHTLAAESGYSRTHFLRLFRASMGCSPHQWLMRLRVERAKQMLQRNAAPLIDIAAACGFASHAHLSKIFRQIVGVPPNRYRRASGLFM
jgi:AraC family transcriptional regulator